MGMFDTIELERQPVCPICRKGVGSVRLQTKAGECLMTNYKIGSPYLSIRTERFSAIFSNQDFGLTMFIKSGYIPCYTICQNCQANLHYLVTLENNLIQRLNFVHFSNPIYSCTIDPNDVDPIYFKSLDQV